MPGIAERVIREPDVQNPRHYALRVYRLAAAYAGLFVGALAGSALLVWQAQFYVTLSRRSNVETLTLAFFLVFFTYLAALSLGGALGAVRILFYAVRPGVVGVITGADVQRRTRSHATRSAAS